MKVKIKDYDYVIIEVDEIKCDDPNRINFGLTNFEKQQILILKSLNNVRKRNTLIHEITHAFLETYGFSDRLFNEEELCCFNEVYLEDILKIVNDYFNKRSVYENI